MKAEGWAEQALLWSESKPNGLSGGGHHLSKYLSQRMKVSFELGPQGAELCSLPPSSICSFNETVSGWRTIKSCTSFSPRVRRAKGKAPGFGCACSVSHGRRLSPLGLWSLARMPLDAEGQGCWASLPGCLRCGPR